jgi:osmoprotectant transport system ATP-binding protein
VIRLEQVTKRYGETIAVNQLSLEISEGEVCVIIGPSGCGKTTTLRMINRLIEPTAGRIFIDGRDTTTVDAEKLRLSIGYAIQSVGLFPHMTVFNNIAVVPQLLLWDNKRIARRVTELLELVGLEPADYTGKYPGQLSGGEAQRIGVARALAADPPILLMDEPFGAVDPLTRERLQAQFIQIQKEVKKTIVLVTHDLDEAIRLADLIAIMESGRLVQYDSPETILSRPGSKFVRDFVGADRALKRLSRISVKDFIKPPVTVNVNRPKKEVLDSAAGHRWLWVVGDDERLVGWVDRSALIQSASVKEAMDEGDAAKIALLESATLREALSRMLGLGFKYIPVVDDRQRLVGEVALGDIEAATAEGEG